MKVDLSHALVGGLLVACAACGKPAATFDASGGASDGASTPNNGPGSPGDGPVVPNDGPDGPGDGPGRPADGRATDAILLDASRPNDATAADAVLLDSPRPNDAPAADAALLDAPRPNDAPAADAVLADASGPPGAPSLGAHAMNFYHLGMTTALSISTPAMPTRASGSMIVVGVGRGDNTLFALPTDNKGNVPYQQVGIMHPYLHPFETSGTAAYEFTSARGGSDFMVTTTTGPISTGQGDEITLAAVEVVGGTRIQQQVWNVIAQDTQNPVPVTSNSVTTTGPATLIAIWWGDAFPNTPQSATPNNGFVVVDTNAQEIGSFVQCAVAFKNVTAPGTYNVTWTSTPVQGAQLWLIAVQ